MQLRFQGTYKSNPRILLQRAGYVQFLDPNTKETSYVRKLTANFYPRFHCYIELMEGEPGFFVNLHLDQKHVSYEGSNKHSGEYDGEVVLNEAKRMAGILLKEKMS
jgi:hypothetical protein